MAKTVQVQCPNIQKQNESFRLGVCYSTSGEGTFHSLLGVSRKTCPSGSLILIGGKIIPRDVSHGDSRAARLGSQNNGQRDHTPLRNRRRQDLAGSALGVPMCFGSTGLRLLGFIIANYAECVNHRHCGPNHHPLTLLFTCFHVKLSRKLSPTRPSENQNGANAVRQNPPII